MPLETPEEISRYGRKQTYMRRPSQPAVVPDGEKSAEKQVLMVMMKRPETAEIYRNELGYLNDPVNDALANLILSYLSRYGKADPLDLLHETEDPAVQQRISEIYSSQAWQMEVDEDSMHGAIRRIRMNYYEQCADALKRKLDTSHDDEEKKSLLKQYSDTLIQLRRLHNEQNQ
jgi:hypothetical protein